MADHKDKATNKLQARLPRGLGDRGPAEIAATRAMLATIRKVYELYGFEPVETPTIEYTDALGKFLPDQDRPNEGVFSFKDDDEQWLSLRYDLTAPLARYVAENFDRLPKPYRSYREGYVYRNEKPGPGRFRQFMQFDADTVGSASMAADAEICMMAADTMEALGIPRGSYVVKVSNRKVLDGVLETINLGGEANASKELTVLRAIDKLDRLGLSGVRQLLGAGRKDESGDFTKGAALADDQISAICAFLEIRVATPVFRSSEEERLFNRVVVRSLNELRRFQTSTSYQSGINELNEIAHLVAASGYGYNRIQVDHSVVRGLEYYTGPVYEVELTFPITGDDGKPVRFGSVAGGGRYDGLVARFRGEPVPATGFSIGVSRLLAALTHLGKINVRPEPGPVIVTVFDKARLDDYQHMVSALRQADIRTELYLGPGKFGPQMKYADRRRSPCVVIQGTDEKQKGEVQIKDLILGAELAGVSKERDDYLKKQADAQFAVPEERLVDAVREVLARHTSLPMIAPTLKEMDQALGEFLTEIGRVELKMLLLMETLNEAPLEFLFDEYSGEPFGNKIKIFKKWCDFGGVPDEHKPTLRKVYKDLDDLLPMRNFLVHGETWEGTFMGEPRQPYRVGLVKKNLEYLDEFDRGEHGDNVFDVQQVRDATQLCANIVGNLDDIRERIVATAIPFEEKPDDGSGWPPPTR